MDEETLLRIVLLVFLVLSLCTGIFFIVYGSVRHSHTKFIKKYSKSYQALETLNSRYRFEHVKDVEVYEEYDSEVNYSNVSCTDYLIGYLNENLKRFEGYLASTYKNRVNYVLYEEELKKINVHQGYLVDIKPKKENKLLKREEKLFNKATLKPHMYLNIKIFIKYVDMGKNLKARKDESFKEDQIRYYIKGLKDKKGKKYNNEKIWNSLVKYERGKVSLHMRFYIYDRDGYRCKKCGRHGRRADLEIDHIVPISRGGKSVPSNLQTLCKSCNYHKGTRIERY